jgi:hypothetical protein
MMTFIDKILNEWAFRCHNGIVDIYNPEKLNILNEIFIEEGIYIKDNNVIFTISNGINDLLHINLKNNIIKGVNVFYSMDYNQDYPKGSEIKDLADKIKYLNLTNEEKEKLYNIISKDINNVFSRNFKPKTVYYLESSAPLSKTIGDIIKDNYSDIEVLPLKKIEFPSWEDMLISDYKDKIKSKDILQMVENIAKDMWKNNKGVIRSSKTITSSIRDYFKPKYNLEDILEKEKIMFVDDNIQTGTDFKSISDKFFNIPALGFYAAIRINIGGSKSTQASKILKTIMLPFKFKREDLLQLKNNIAVKNTHPDIKILISKGYVDKIPSTVPNKGIYYIFKNNNLKIDDLI